MKRLCFLLGILFVIASCGALPKIHHPDSRELSEAPPKCRCLFLQGRWQFQHAIEATLPGGHKSVLMGVSIVSADCRSD